LDILQDILIELLDIELDLQHPNVDMGFRNGLRHLGTLKTGAISLIFIVPPPLTLKYRV
jgi:hypothetical protein